MISTSVVVVNWNRRALLQECLESLQQQWFQDFELIVVDNGSSDGSTEMVAERHPGAQLIQLPENRGFAVGNNIGIRRARGRYIALLNNDAVADPEWLGSLVGAMEGDPSVGTCASKIVFYDQPQVVNSTGIVYFTVGLAEDRDWLVPTEAAVAEQDEPIGACAAAALYRKAMLDDIGLFDEDFSPAYFEDVDLSLRAQLCGYRCRYVPTALVRHRFASTLGYRSSASIYFGVRNSWYTLIKDMPAGILVRRGPEIAAYAVLKFGLHCLKGDALPYLQGTLAGCLGLPRMLLKRREIQRRRSIPPAAFEQLLARGRLGSDIRRVMKRGWSRLVGRPLPSAAQPPVQR